MQYEFELTSLKNDVRIINRHNRIRSQYKYFNRNHKKNKVLIQNVGGPYDCIDDHVEKAYCDDAKVSMEPSVIVGKTSTLWTQVL